MHIMCKYAAENTPYVDTLCVHVHLFTHIVYMCASFYFAQGCGQGGGCGRSVKHYFVHVMKSFSMSSFTNFIRGGCGRSVKHYFVHIMKSFSTSSFTNFIQHPVQFAMNLETHILHEIIKNYGDYQSRNNIYIRFTITCYEYSIALLTGSVRP